MIMRGSLVMDENISNLTSTISGDQQSMTSTNHAPPHKRKRSLPGNPDPDAEVIGLSPKTLMAANRFVCEICNKGFQRDQNLQLHRRGHNLPWKLKQRSSKEVVRKKVYVCPEAGCVHHNPARALGDLTGIKKHFSRKHGEKKWKCDKCSKRYAVQSDWKAHTKICGTRAYRCDCGTLFSRRDSFITHRAFCDALAEESGKSMTTTTTTTEDNYNNISVDNIPPWHQATDEGAVLFSGLPSAHMSATALLQKAAQMGVTTTTSSSVSSVLTGTPAATGGVLGGGHMNRYTSNVNQGGVGCDLVAASQPANSSSSLLLHDMIMSSFSSTTFDNHDHQGFTFTRDFLGLKPPFPQTTAAAGFGNISCLALLNSDSSSTYVYQNNEHPNHTPCQGYRPSHHP